MATLTVDEVREWVDNRVTFERWLRAQHAERAQQGSAPGDGDAPVDVRGDRGGQPERSWRLFRVVLGWTRRSMRRGGNIKAPHPIEFGPPRKDCEAQDPRQAA